MTEQAMKTLELIVDCLTVSIDDSKYFGFVPRRGIVCVVWQLQEVSLAVRKMLHITVDLEKTFEHIPREVICWAPRKLNVEKWIALLVLARITTMRLDLYSIPYFSSFYWKPYHIHFAL